MTEFYRLDAAESLRELRSDAAGLADDEARRRLAEHGPNVLEDRGVKSPWTILREQMSELMVIILIIASVISAALGIVGLAQGHAESMSEIYDAIAIAVIVVLNAILGVSQEYRAERAMAALKKLAVPSVKARRGGQVVEVSARDLVPGDVVLLEAGNLVPADCRLLEAANLRVQEAALTGEAEAVDKHIAKIDHENLPLGDRLNMCYTGTIITYGRGLGVVTATGMRTQLGGIATMIQTVTREPTPLQKKLEQLGKALAAAALVLVTVVFIQGLIRNGVGFENIKLMFLTAVSMAVAAVPEGLPAVVTISLALGAQRMLRRKALIRKLLAVESLGSVTVICSDKTGTLTENRMTVTMLDVAGHQVNFSEQLRRSQAAINGDETQPYHEHELLAQSGIAMLLMGGALCNDSALQTVADKPGHFQTLGDPTEGALVLAAAHMGLLKDDLEKALPRVGEAPFDSDRKRMTTLHRRDAGAGVPPAIDGTALAIPVGAVAAFTKGAVDSMMEVCDRVWADGQVQPLTPQRRQQVAASNDRLAQSGMRVLGVAFRLMSTSGGTPVVPEEKNLIFVGLVGMIDPPRAEVKQAVATCKAAGIRPIMITGDHPLTALHIAKQLGISDSDRALTGAELEKMSLADLEAQVDTVSVYARVSPEHKLKIVQALQDRGQIVAMTGDGVNDAPALKKSDIGVAMGITGTDVSKEAADMVLQDDNFATIVAAIEEGRVIYDNIRKFIKYLLTTNSGEIWVMFLAPFLVPMLTPILGPHLIMPLPLIPLQILWINLVTDGLPALALGVEPPERGTMTRPPIRPGESVFAHGMGLHVLWVGLLMAGVSLLGAGIYWYGNATEEAEYHVRHFRTMVFTIVTLSQMAHVLAIRTGRDSLFRAGLFTNKPMLAAVGMTIGFQFILIYAPFMQGLFETVPLSAMDVLIALGLSSVIFWAVEVEKWVQRRRA